VLKLRHDDSRFLREPIRIADRGYFRTLLRERRPVVSDGVRGRGNGEPMVVIAYPVLAEGEVVAVLAGVAKLQSRSLTAGVSDLAEDDDDALVAVTDSAGQIIAHPDAALLLAPLASESRLDAAVADWRTKGAPLEPTGLELRDPRAVVTAAAVPGADWMVWRQRSTAALLAPLRAGRTAALRWALAAIGGLSTLSVLLGWLAPGEIGRLEQVLRRVGAERAGLEEANRDIIRRLQTVMAAAPVGIAFTRRQCFELVSREFCRLLGYEAQALLNLPTRAILASEQAWHELGAQVGKAFAAGRAYDGEHEMVRADGSRFWGHLRGLPVNPGDADAGTIWTLQDITEQVASRRALEWAALHDPLTGLANRKAFASRLEHLFEGLPRSRPAALVALDLDHFKPINDSHGHAAGDQLLRAVAAAISQQVRPGDLVARLGGDEFAVVLERCPADAATRVAAQVRAAVGALRVAWQGTELAVGTSVGVALLDETIEDPAAWLDAADRACYRAKLKRGGRSQPAETAPIELA